MLFYYEKKHCTIADKRMINSSDDGINFRMVPIEENVVTLRVPVYDWWLLAVQIG